jgi:hypothetical protein
MSRRTHIRFREGRGIAPPGYSTRGHSRPTGDRDPACGLAESESPILLRLLCAPEGLELLQLLPCQLSWNLAALHLL